MPGLLVAGEYIEEKLPLVCMKNLNIHGQASKSKEKEYQDLWLNWAENEAVRSISSPDAARSEGVDPHRDYRMLNRMIQEQKSAQYFRLSPFRHPPSSPNHHAPTALTLISTAAMTTEGS
jgi:cytochrome oxidase assembly protein ShyY1